MNSPPDISSPRTLLASALAALAVLAVRLIGTILRRNLGKDWGRFQSANIEWGSYRIRVSRPPRSASHKLRAKRSVVRGSGSMEASSPMDASSSSMLTDFVWNDSSAITQDDLRSSGEGVPSDLVSRGRGQEP